MTRAGYPYPWYSLGVALSFADAESRCSLVLGIRASAAPINGEWLAREAGLAIDILEEGSNVHGDLDFWEE